MRDKLLPPFIGAALLVAVALLFGSRDPWALVVMAFVGYATAATVREFTIGAGARRKAHGERWDTALFRLMGANPRRYGGYISHIGIFLVAIGIAASGGSRSEREATLAKGETLSVAGQTVRLRQVWGIQEPQRYVIGATLDVLSSSGEAIDSITPRMNFYNGSDQPVPTPDVRSTITGDLYANLQAFRDDGTTATIKLIRSPLVSWIWVGGGVVVLGALFGMFAGARRSGEEAT